MRNDVFPNVISFSDEQILALAKNTKKGRNFKFKALEGQLFPENGLSLKDVGQLGLGECFFDSSIISFISSHPELLKDIFAVQEDGTVIGKAYIFNSDSREYEPCYFRLDYSDFMPDSVLMPDFIATNYHEHANYVVMLEKLYAVAKLYEIQQNQQVYNEVLGCQQPLEPHFVSLLNDNFSGDVIARLTGKKPAVFHAVKGQALELLLSLQATTKKEDITCHLVVFQQMLEQVSASENSLQLEPLFDQIVENITIKISDTSLSQDTFKHVKAEIISFFKDNQFSEEGRSNMLSEVALLIDYLIAYDSKRVDEQPVIAEKIGQFKNLPEYFKKLQESIVEIEKEKKQLSEVKKTKINSTDRYTKIEVSLYNRLKKSVENHQAITAGANKSIGGVSEMHYYSVLDVREYAGKKYILVANPWKIPHKAAYVLKKDGGIKSKASYSEEFPDLACVLGGEIEKKYHEGNESGNSFLLELSDFSRIMEDVSISSACPDKQKLFMIKVEKFLEWYRSGANAGDEERQQVIDSIIDTVNSGCATPQNILRLLSSLFKYINTDKVTPENNLLIKTLNHLEQEYAQVGEQVDDQPLTELQLDKLIEILQSNLNVARIIGNAGATDLLKEIEQAAENSGSKLDLHVATSDPYERMAKIYAEILLSRTPKLQHFTVRIKSCWEYEKVQAAINKDTHVNQKIDNIQKILDDADQNFTQPKSLRKQILQKIISFIDELAKKIESKLSGGSNIDNSSCTGLNKNTNSFWHLNKGNPDSDLELDQLIPSNS